MPKSSFFVVAHSNIEQFIGNKKTIIEAYKKLNIDTDYDELYINYTYPNYKINVKAKLDKLVKSRCYCSSSIPYLLV